MATGFRWINPPSALAKNIEAYGKRVLVAVHTVAARVGHEMQDDARMHAPWEDRTGNARSGLFFAVDGFGLPPIIGQVSPGAAAQKSDVVVESGSDGKLLLTLGHTVYYGKYLETVHGVRYAIVMSTMESHLPELEKMLEDLFA